MMQRIKAVLAYDGTAFAGYQVQPNARTVQGEIEAALKKMHKGKAIRIYASGRTDAGVHAVGQVIHFDTTLNIKEQNWLKAFQALLPDDIVVHGIEYVQDDFHARFHAKKKEYRYRLFTKPFPDVFRRNYTLHVPYTLDINAMKEAMALIVGTHDFTSFCASKTNIEEKTRTIFEADILEEDGELVFRFVGNGFLYNMVRILVGTLLEVGKKERNHRDITEILEAKSRDRAGITAPAHGLVLWSVHY